MMGHDFGDSVEILSGVTASDFVIVNPSDCIYSGQNVQVAKQGA